MKQPVKPSRVLAVVGLAVFLSILDLFIVNIAFPDLRRDFEGSSLSGLSWVLTAYAIVYAAVLVPAGRLGDLYGRRRLFVIGLALFTLGSALCALAPSLELLIAARVLQGIGAAALTPNSLGLVLPLFPAEKRSTVIGAWAGIGAVGASVAPPLGGLLVEVSWRLIFIVNVPLGLIAIVLALRLAPEVRDARATRLPDVPGHRDPRRGGRPAHARPHAGHALGLGRARRSAPSSPRRSSARCSCAAAPATRRPSSSSRSCACRRSRSPGSRRCCSRPASPGCCSATSSSSRRCGTTRCSRPASRSRRDRCWRRRPRSSRAASPTAASPPPSARSAASCSRPAACGSSRTRARDPAYLTAILPGQVLTGIGVGLLLPSFTATAAATLQPDQLATGIGVQTMCRQIGAALGLAAWVAIVGTPSPGDAVDAFGLRLGCSWRSPRCSPGSRSCRWLVGASSIHWRCDF